MQFASRSGILEQDDNFFGYKSSGLEAWLRPRVVALHNALRRTGAAADADAVVVYGELFGGFYPNSESPEDVGVRAVQRGCWYSPDIKFVAFDVAIGAFDREMCFLPFDRAMAIATDAGIPFSQPLLRGTFQECLDFDIRFTSKIPSMLGLRALSNYPNWAEGVVIRRAQESVASHGQRAMLKLKIPELKEKQVRLHVPISMAWHLACSRSSKCANRVRLLCSQYSNEMWRQARNPPSSKGGCRSWSDATVLRYEMLSTINQQRLDNTVSKFGSISPGDRQAYRKLLEAFMADVIETLCDDGLLQAPSDLLQSHVLLHQELEECSRRLISRWLREQKAMQL